MTTERDETMSDKVTNKIKAPAEAANPVEGVVMPRYEYYLGFWGQINNDKLVERELGIEEKDFWFSTKEERAKFKTKLNSVADKYKVIIAFKEEEGEHVRFRTVARMIMVMPNGKEYPYEEDFGYAYEPDAARYMFEDGNYSCDCNKSLFLSREHPEIEEMDCGDEIQIKNFTVVHEA